MKLRKVIALALITSLLIPLSPATAAVKAGAVCKKAGIKSVVAGKTFTCVKSGKKLVWRILSAKIAQDDRWYAWSFRYDNKDKLERKSSTSTSWSSEATRPGQVIDPVRSLAFDKIQQYIASIKTPRVEFKVNFSPNVTLDAQKTILRYFEKSMDFFRAALPENSRLETVIATEKDDEYIKTKILEIEKNSPSGYDTYERTKSMFQQFAIANPFDTSGGGTVGTTSQPNVSLYLGAVCSCFKGEHVLMFNIPHEVTHYFQFATTPSVKKQNLISINGQLTEPKIYIPLLLMEGSANTIGSALIVEHVGWYSDQMDWHVGRLKSSGFMSEIASKEDALKLLLEFDSWLPSKNQQAPYILGQLQYEFFISKYGVQAFLDLFKNIEKFGDYERAIEVTIGKTKSEFYFESAEYVMRSFNRVKQ